MSDFLVDAVANLIIPDQATFASLPLALACRIFLALPAVARGRACCVCRAWRDALAEPSLWTRLDLSDVARPEWQRFRSVLRRASRRARGQLCHLDLSQYDVARDVLLPVLTANAGSLRELHLRSVDDTKFEAVMAAAPQLQLLTAEYVSCTWEDAPRMLRAEPPFAALQMRCRLTVSFSNDAPAVGGMERFAPFAAALADATLQPALLHLHVWYVDTALPAFMGALADAALARRLRKLRLSSCTPPPATMVARLLAEGSLASFELPN